MVNNQRFMVLSSYVANSEFCEDVTSFLFFWSWAYSEVPSLNLSDEAIVLSFPQQVNQQRETVILYV